jgi:hypothetical protein
MCSNPLIEDYTEIFYMAGEGDVPSVQCKMSLRRPKSMRKVDGLSLILIDFHVLAVRHGPRRKLCLHGSSVVMCSFVSAGTICYGCRCLTMYVFSSPIIPAFSLHVIIWNRKWQFISVSSTTQRILGDFLFILKIYIVSGLKTKIV